MITFSNVSLEERLRDIPDLVSISEFKEITGYYCKSLMPICQIIERRDIPYLFISREMKIPLCYIKKYLSSPAFLEDRLTHTSFQVVNSLYLLLLAAQIIISFDTAKMFLKISI